MAKSIPGSPLTLFASASRTATSTSDVHKIAGDQYSGLCVIIDCTVDGAAASVTFSVESNSNLAGDSWTTQLDSPAVAATGSTILVLHEDAPTDRANAIEKTPIEPFWRITATHADADAITYSVVAWPLV